MKKQSLNLLVITLALIGLTAGYLAKTQGSQRLGNPGVKLSPEPLYDPEGKVLATNSVLLPAQVLDYQSEPLPVTQLEFSWLPKDTLFGRRLYRDPKGSTLAVTVILAGTDRTAIHKPEFCLTGQGFRIVQKVSDTVTVETPQRYDLPLKVMFLSREQATATGQKMQMQAVFAYWFVTDDLLTADHFQRMWWTAKEVITTGKLQRWAYISCYNLCAPGQENETLQRIKQWIAAAAPQLQTVAGTAHNP
jgi:hypothetical protein